MLAHYQAENVRNGDSLLLFKMVKAGLSPALTIHCISLAADVIIKVTVLQIH